MVAFRWKCLTAISLVSALSTAAAYSETITVNGTNGTFPGGDATKNAGPGPGPDATNTANAFGGTGGVLGGIGYNGGDATATATTSITSGPASAYGTTWWIRAFWKRRQRRQRNIHFESKHVRHQFGYCLGQCYGRDRRSLVSDQCRKLRRCSPARPATGRRSGHRVIRR